jgi:hypothetical protein
MVDEGMSESIKGKSFGSDVLPSKLMHGGPLLNVTHSGFFVASSSVKASKDEHRIVLWYSGNPLVGLNTTAFTMTFEEAEVISRPLQMGVGGIHEGDTSTLTHAASPFSCSLARCSWSIHFPMIHANTIHGKTARVKIKLGQKKFPSNPLIAQLDRPTFIKLNSPNQNVI